VTDEELYEIDPYIVKKNAELTWWLELEEEGN